MEDTFISVDCETSGPFPGRHALLAVGAAVVVQRAGRWEIANRYYDEWAPTEDADEDPAATRVHGLDLAALRVHGTPPSQGAQKFADWVASAGAGRRIFVGYNAAFDWAFVLHSFGIAGVANPFHHAPLDLKSTIWGLHGGSWRGGSNIDALVQVLGRPLPTRDGLRHHHAGDDALMQADVLVELLQRLGNVEGGR